MSGWLNVSIPSEGATARRHLVDALGADLFVAGTYKPTDCAGTVRRERDRLRLRLVFERDLPPSSSSSRAFIASA